MPVTRSAVTECRWLLVLFGILMWGCGDSAKERPAEVPRPAANGTIEASYSPFARDGSVRPDLTVIGSAEPADCPSGSYLVSSAYRCFIGSEIQDVCYLDRRDPALPSLVCVSSPWATRAIRASFSSDPVAAGGAKPGGPQWALELTDRGRRCTFTPGATTVAEGRRANYYCAGQGVSDAGLTLYGKPDRSRAVWRIRAGTEDARALRWVNIRRAWR